MLSSSFYSLMDSIFSYFVDDIGVYAHERHCSVAILFFFFFQIMTSTGVDVKELPTSQNETGSVSLASGVWKGRKELVSFPF